MNLRDAEKYLERTLQVTQGIYLRHIERELTIDGFLKRLSQVTDIVYLGVILATFPVCLYSLGKVIPSETERLTIILKNHQSLDKHVLDDTYLSK